jgi:hypothetical protein
MNSLVITITPNQAPVIDGTCIQPSLSVHMAIRVGGGSNLPRMTQQINPAVLSMISNSFRYSFSSTMQDSNRHQVLSAQPTQPVVTTKEGDKTVRPPRFAARVSSRSVF